MNYLAHGIRHLDRPYFLVGSAVPDLLSVVNRRSRVRRRTLEAHLPQVFGAERELALGMMQHLADDQWFHGTPGFYDVTGRLSALFRDELGSRQQSSTDSEWNCSFLGHIVTELLIDATLSESHPGALPRYYEAFREVDPEQVQTAVTRVATVAPVELARFVDLFFRERFLFDYADDERLIFRLNQVMRRVGYPLLPETVLPVLSRSRQLVREHLLELLPESHFAMPEAAMTAAFPGRNPSADR